VEVDEPFDYERLSEYLRGQKDGQIQTGVSLALKLALGPLKGSGFSNEQILTEVERQLREGRVQIPGIDQVDRPEP
jgi:hypothetical protein